jgi:hypothetical protein
MIRARFVVLSLLLVAVIVAVCAGGAEAAVAPRPYRCFRPFKSLDGFSPKHMHSQDNCVFDYMHIQNASATLNCVKRSANAAALVSSELPVELPSAKATAGEKKEVDCTLTVQFTATTLKPRDALALDAARYTFRMAKGGNQIHYKGHDGIGFSACCALIGEGECEWIDVNGTQRRVITKCPFHPANPKDLLELVTFSGSITRPLHSYEPGDWKAYLSFHRNGVEEDDLVGRLVVGYTIPEDLDSLVDNGGSADPSLKVDL